MAVETLEKPPEKPKRITKLLKQPRRRKLTSQDVENVVKIINKLKCTAKAACLHLDINPDQFDVFIHRHRESFERLLAQAKESKLEGLLNRIEDCGDGIGMKQPDWRAAAWLAERIAPERFMPQSSGQQATNAPSVTIEAMLVIVNKTLGLNQPAQAKQLPQVTQSAGQGATTIDAENSLANNDVSSNSNGKSKANNE